MSAPSDFKVILVSQEGEKVPLSMKYIVHSALLSELLADHTRSSQEVPMPLFKTATIQKVVQFLTYYHSNPMQEISRPLKSHILSHVVEKWYADFIDVDQEQIFDLMQLADYLNIKPLIDLTSAKVASMVKNKTPEQIRKMLGVQNDFSAEEEEAVHAENRWAEDV